MFRITVEMVPRGDESKKYLIEKMNVGFFCVFF